jgi:hypothetical protein
METYKKWEPLEGIEAELWVEALHDDYEGLRILLRGQPHPALYQAREGQEG